MSAEKKTKSQKTQNEKTKDSTRKTITERQLIDIIVQKLSDKDHKKDITKNEVKEVITAFKDVMIELIPFYNFKLINFLKIVSKLRKEKVIIKPGTKESMTIGSKYVVRCSAGKRFSEAAATASTADRSKNKNYQNILN